MLVVIIGFGLMSSKENGQKVAEFSQTWIWLSLVLYVVGIGVSHGVMIPTVKKMDATMEQLNALGPPPAGAAASGPRRW